MSIGADTDFREMWQTGFKGSYSLTDKNHVCTMTRNFRKTPDGLGCKGLLPKPAATYIELQEAIVHQACALAGQAEAAALAKRRKHAHGALGASREGTDPADAAQPSSDAQMSRNTRETVFLRTALASSNGRPRRPAGPPLASRSRPTRRRS